MITTGGKCSKMSVKRKAIDLFVVVPVVVLTFDSSSCEAGNVCVYVGVR